ncbi:hypothetical protein Ndes2526B_g06053 [Nannochloris sp. 'desiccata']
MQQPAAGAEQPAPRILSTAEIQQKLEENAMLIKAINERQSVGNLKDCIKYQQKLQENLMMLAALADAQAVPQNPQ